MRVDVIKYEFKRPVKEFDLLNILTRAFMQWNFWSAQVIECRL